MNINLMIVRTFPPIYQQNQQLLTILYNHIIARNVANIKNMSCSSPNLHFRIILWSIFRKLLRKFRPRRRSLQSKIGLNIKNSENWLLNSISLHPNYHRQDILVNANKDDIALCNRIEAEFTNQNNTNLFYVYAPLTRLKLISFSLSHLPIPCHFTIQITVRHITLPPFLHLFELYY